MNTDILSSTLNARINRDAYIRHIVGTVANRLFHRRESSAGSRG